MRHTSLMAAALTAGVASAHPMLHKRLADGAQPGIMPVRYQNVKFRGLMFLGEERSPEYITLDTGSQMFWVRWSGATTPDPTYSKKKKGVYDTVCPLNPPACGADIDTCCAADWTISYGTPAKINKIMGKFRTHDLITAPQELIPETADLANIAYDGPMSSLRIPQQDIRLLDTDDRKDAGRGAGIAGLGFGAFKGSPSLWETGNFGYFTVYTPAKVPQEEWYYGFGVDDETKRRGPYAWLDAVDPTTVYWRVMVGDKVKIGDTELTMPNPTTKVLLDNGTPLTYLPSEIVKAIYDKLEGGNCPEDVIGKCTYDCDYYKTNPMPKIILPWNGEQTIDLVMDSGPYNSVGNKCLGNIQANAIEGKTVYGSNAYMSVYWKFDGANRKVGIAKYPTNADAEETPSEPAQPVAPVPEVNIIPDTPIAVSEVPVAQPNTGSSSGSSAQSQAEPQDSGRPNAPTTNINNPNNVKVSPSQPAKNNAWSDKSISDIWAGIWSSGSMVDDLKKLQAEKAAAAA